MSVPLQKSRAFALAILMMLCLPMLGWAQIATKEAARAAKISTDLLTVMTNGGVTNQAPVAGLQRMNLFQTEGNTIAIDAVANSAGEGQALLQALQALGLDKGIVSNQRVSGYLPIDKLGELKNVGVLRFARPSYKPINNVGAVTSQGDSAMRAGVARRTYSVDGTGVKVGVLSDSYNKLGGAAAGVASGDLPTGVQVLKELPSAGGSDEGRAMIELIHDVAPGSPQAFYTAFDGILDFAAGIRALAAAGCKVITDDVAYFAEPFFQDGPIAQAIDDVVSNSGVTYFSSAGNSARSSYQSAYSSTSPPASPTGLVGAHDFGGGDKFQSLTIAAGRQVIISFQWDNPFFSVSGGAGAQTDMDLLVYVGGVYQGTLSSANDNLGGDPVEVIGLTNTGGTAVVVELVLAKFDGPDPTIVKWVNFGSTSATEYNTRSSTAVGHTNSSRCISVGAAPFFRTPAFDPALTTAVIEAFSSAGGTPIYFTTTGTRLSAPVVRQKPEITAVDGTNTTFFGSDTSRDPDAFPNFFGTSAAAPHAAAVAALMKQKVPAITPATILSTLESTALDMDDPFTAGFDAGFDFGTGFGFIQADRALQAISPAPNAAPVVANVIAPQSATVGQAFNFTVPANTFSDPNGDILTVSITGLPAGLSASESVISGTPSMSGVSTVTVTATDPGSLSVSTTFQLTVSPADVVVPPTPTGPFSITGVTTVSCTTISAGQRQISFTPQYAGLSGQPISFSVVNELLPTTAPGPYTLNPYTDNPVFTLKATQQGTAGEASFTYNWLAACGTTVVPPTPTGPFSITGVTTVSCTTISAGQRQISFTPQYAGANGQPITFQIVNELLPTTAPGPYTLNPYTDNPVFTLKATQQGTAGEASFTYNWLAACGTTVVPPTPTGPFSITGVTTVSCTTISAGQRQISFTPQYAGANGQPITFQVVNESLPTTAPGPYTLNPYTDNPSFTLKATQQGTAGEATFTYNWLAACNGGGARLAAPSSREATLPLSVSLYPNPVGEEFAISIQGAQGQTVRVALTDLSGRLVSNTLVDVTTADQRETLRFSQQRTGLYLLRVSTAKQAVTVKVVKQ